LDTSAAAAYLHHQPKTLSNWRLLGRGPRYVRIGKKPLYRTADLDAYVESRVFEHTTAEIRP
jgi:hypothetical protein